MNISQHFKTVHNGQSLKCDICNESFHCSFNLSEHVRQVHKRGNESFDGLENLLVHKNKVHKQDQEMINFESFDCEKCGISLSSSKLLKMHKVMVHQWNKSPLIGNSTFEVSVSSLLLSL